MGEPRPVGPESQRSVRLIVRGRVQGVGMRAWAKRTADRLDVTGWIRNREDGTVELTLAGSASAVARFRQLLREGPRLARVIEVRDKGPGVDVPEDDFEIRP